MQSRRIKLRRVLQAVVLSKSTLCCRQARCGESYAPAMHFLLWDGPGDICRMYAYQRHFVGKAFCGHPYRHGSKNLGLYYVDYKFGISKIFSAMLIVRFKTFPQCIAGVAGESL